MHGGRDHCRNWDWVAEKLRDRYHVIAPDLRGRVETQLHSGVNHACEIVIDGTNEEVVGVAMAVAIRAAAGPEILAISAGNYGGKLGKFQYRLHEVLK